MHRRLSLIALLALSLLTAVVLAASSFTGKVVAVHDGDTITVLQGRQQVKVRLFGIDCPENHQAWGERAKQCTSNLVFGKQVRVDVLDRDRYGRSVGEVWVGKKLVNAAIVDAGLAWAYTQYSGKYVWNEQQARKAKRGLWADKHPIPPWEFRHPSRRAATQPWQVGRVRSAAPPTADTVHITKTGKKYHRAGCRHLAKSDTPISRKDAVARGYSPCKVCKP